MLAVELQVAGMEMKMWRYLVKYFDIVGQGSQAFEGFLLEWGQDGWELVSTTQTPTSGLLLIFKKPASR